jgi:hypothetical protein
MIARPAPDAPLEYLHAAFLAIVPRIERHGEIYFRHVRCPHRRADFIAEMVAVSWRWFVRATQKGKDVNQFVTALATYAARHVRSGRRLCGQEKGKDALSPLAQTRHNFVVEKLPDFSTLSSNPVAEALQNNTKTPPPEQAAFRLDFPAWLSTLGARKRSIAEDLMVGERTLDVADRYGLCPARVSQLRAEFRRDWRRFCGEFDPE